MKLNHLPVLLVSASLLAACSSAGASTSSATTLTAVKVSSATLDASASYWANAPKIDVATKGANKAGAAGPIVTLQAVYDGSTIVVRAEWADTTDSWVRNAWTWNGTTWKKGGDQDRLSLAFPMSNNAAFASKGCGAVCHNTDPDPKNWWMGTDSADVRVDVWQWQSAQTNPMGQADDQYWGPRVPITATTGRKNDVLDSGGSKTNATKDNKAPMYMSKNGLDAHYILAGEEVPLDMSAVTSGTIIPGYILSPYKGSRGDISAQGTWANGKWVVVISRALNTGHDDDAALTPPKAMPFGLAVFNNAGDVDHTISQEVLTLAWQ